MGDESITYSLKYAARVLVSQTCDSVNSKWLVGTTALREENEIRILQYDPDQEQLVCKQCLIHNNEIWDIAPCPTSEDLLITVWSKGGNSSATLWQINDHGQLEQQTELTGQTSTVRCALWHATQTDLVVTVEEGHLKKWHITESGAECVATCPAGEMLQLWSGALHPRNASLLCTAGGNNVQVWDLRTLSKPTAEMSQAHRMPVRTISFSPHSDTRIVTAGDDCKLRFWDLRMAGKGEALLELGGHRHWVWQARYNAQYDSLIATASSDCMVNLYFTPQLAAAGAAAAPSDTAAPREQVAKAPAVPMRSGDLDGKVTSWDEHEDSVYGLAWSAADPWLLASLSYDGRVALHKVPKNIKYKILI